jgi:hypothetical protein
MIDDFRQHALLILLCKFKQDMEIFPEPGDAIPLRQNLDCPGFLRLELSGLPGILPDIRVGKLFFELG